MFGWPRKGNWPNWRNIWLEIRLVDFISENLKKLEISKLIRVEMGGHECVEDGDGAGRANGGEVRTNSNELASSRKGN